MAIGTGIAIIWHDWPNWSSGAEVAIFLLLLIVLIIVVSLVFELKLVPNSALAPLFAGLGILLFGVAWSVSDILIGIIGVICLIGATIVWYRTKH